MKIMKKLYQLLVFILILPALIGMSAGCRQDGTMGDIDRSQVEVIFDDSVMVDEIRWELMEAEDLGPSITNDYGASFQAREGKLIYISFAVENMGEEIRQIFDMKVVDDKGNYYSVCNEAYGYFSAPAVCTVQDIIPGVRREFNASFDVPLDSVDLLLEVTDLRIPAGEKKYIDLGI